MNVYEIKKLFETKFSKYFSTIAEISKDDNNSESLCYYYNYNKFLDFDKIAKEYHPNWPTVDMIFFDLERDYIVFVEYKNGKIKSKDKPKIKQKLLDSLALFYTILGIDRQKFWNLKTYLIFVTNKDKNNNQVNHRKYLSSTDDFLDILEDNIILYGFDVYKPWYFNEIKTPFCNEFAELMGNEFKIKLEDSK